MGKNIGVQSGLVGFVRRFGLRRDDRIRAASRERLLSKPIGEDSPWDLLSVASNRKLAHRVDRRNARRQLGAELIGGEGPIGPEFRDIFSVGTASVHINPGMLVGVSRCAAPVRTTVHPSHADILLKLRMHHVHPYAPSWCMRNRH